MNQVGGIIIKTGSRRDAFLFFISNSICRLFSYTTSGGILFRLTLNPDVPSPYLTNRSNTPQIEVRELIIKIALLNEDKEYYRMTHPFVNLSPTTSDEFLSEMRRQMDVFNGSLNEDAPQPSALEPCCPSIVIGTILGPIGPNSILEVGRVFKTLFNNMHEDEYEGRHIMQRFLTELILSGKKSNSNYIIRKKENDSRRDVVFRFGIIGMECMTGYVTAADSHFRHAVPAQKIRGMVLFELFRLYNLGYLHGDPHMGNFLIDMNYKYFDGRLGRAIIIDFGRSFSYSQKLVQPPQVGIDNIADIAHISLTVDGPGVPDGRNAKHSSYQWLNLTSKEADELNISLKIMFLAREKFKFAFRRHILLADASAAKSSTIGGGPVLDEIDEFAVFVPNNVFTSNFISNYVEEEERSGMDAIALGVRDRVNKSKSTRKKQRKAKTKENKKKQVHRKKTR
jgi:hypothetical protein